MELQNGNSIIEFSSEIQELEKEVKRELINEMLGGGRSLRATPTSVITTPPSYQVSSTSSLTWTLNHLILLLGAYP